MTEQSKFFDEPEEEKKKTYPPVSVYLSAEEQIEAQELADKAGVSRHALLQYAVRYFIAEYKKDKKILKTEKKTVLGKPE